MTSRHRLLLALRAAAAWALACSAGAPLYSALAQTVEPPPTRALRHDPFAQPAPARPPTPVAPVAPAAAVEPEPPPVPWQPKLSAVIAGKTGVDAMALVDGLVVEIGQEVAGHRLVRVGERSATFVRLGVSVEINLDSASAAVK